MISLSSPLPSSRLAHRPNASETGSSARRSSSSWAAPAHSRRSRLMRFGRSPTFRALDATVFEEEPTSTARTAHFGHESWPVAAEGVADQLMQLFEWDRRVRLSGQDEQGVAYSCGDR